MNQPTKTGRTMAQLCQEALNVQDACNLSGVVHSFSRAMTDLRALLDDKPGFSTDDLNRHHVAVLWSSKIASLTGSEYGDRFHAAYKFAQQTATD